jgi:hypothetical protein
MRRYVTPSVDAAVWIASGRWGPKRVKVTQCWAVLKAEDVYTDLLRDNPAGTRPGRHGDLDWRLPGREPIRVDWELRANAVWRFGRAFLTCPKCSRPATRIYVPTVDASAACRRCWGLTYESRRENYKRSGSVLGMSHRVHAHLFTWSARETRAAAAAERYAERREILRRECQGRP